MGVSSSFHPIRILLVGDTATGKRCYVKRILDKFPHDTQTNKECDISSITVKIDENTDVSIQIFNIRGAERGKTKLKHYFKNIDGYIIMFDVTQAETYDNVLGWKKDVDGENKPFKLPCILLANKCDLEKDEGVKNQMDVINNYCKTFDFYGHFETSSKDNIGIQESIQHLIREIIKFQNISTQERNSCSRSSTLTSDHHSSSPPSTTDHRSSASTSDRRSSSPPLTTDPRPQTDRYIPRPPSPPRQQITLKIIVIGEPVTGKTAIIQRYAQNKFSGQYRSTIGTDVAYKRFSYNNDFINIHIWDIAGSERFGTLTHLFYRDAAGCLVVFDVSRASTLNGAIKWKADFDTKVNFDPNNPIPCLLVGNKSDLNKEDVVKNATSMTDFCHTHQFIRWFETSARNNTNIVDTFSFLVEQIMNNRTGVRTRPTSDRIIIDPTHSPQHIRHNWCKN